jgi:hypothetical protein
MEKMDNKIRELETFKSIVLKSDKDTIRDYLLKKFEEEGNKKSVYWSNNFSDFKHRTLRFVFNEPELANGFFNISVIPDNTSSETPWVFKSESFTMSSDSNETKSCPKL